MGDVISPAAVIGPRTWHRGDARDPVSHRIGDEADDPSHERDASGRRRFLHAGSC